MNDLRTRKATNAGTEPGLQPGSDKKHFSLTPAKFEGKPTNSYRRTSGHWGQRGCSGVQVESPSFQPNIRFASSRHSVDNNEQRPDGPIRDPV